jgi:hypothetical protein
MDMETLEARFRIAGAEKYGKPNWPSMNRADALASIRVDTSRRAKWKALLCLIASAVVIGLILFGAWPARAQGVDTVCFSSVHGFHCTTRVVPAPVPEAAQDRADREEREARFDTVCKPHAVEDSEGIMRMRYARPGCERGITQ